MNNWKICFLFFLSSAVFAQMPAFSFFKKYIFVSNPSSLTLSQTSSYRTFTVSWSAGTGNGGANGCKLQYFKDGTTWTDLTGTYNCDAVATNVAASFPATANWTNNFNATGVQVRLLRVSDSGALGTFSQKGVCSTLSGSGSSTPDIDEDCNGVWDNVITNNYSCNCQYGWYDMQVSFHFVNANCTGTNSNYYTYGPYNFGGYISASDALYNGWGCAYTSCTGPTVQYGACDGAGNKIDHYGSGAQICDTCSSNVYY